MKRIVCLIFTAALLLPLCLGVVTKASAAEENALRESIVRQFDAYAASIYQPEAHNLAVKQLLNHSLRNSGKQLEMDENDGFTASLFQSAMFREFMIEALTYVGRTMQENQEEKALIGTDMLSWHDYALLYRLGKYEYTESRDHRAHAVLDRPIPQTEYQGTWNQHDKAMALVVGGASCRMWISKTDINREQVTYHINFGLKDEFSFDGDYSEAAKDGYDVSTSMLISMAGKLFLNTYTWYTTVSFDIIVPNICSHDNQTANYRWVFNGSDLVSMAGNGNSENGLIRIQTENKDGTLLKPYYQVSRTVNLWHNLPWVLEYRMKGSSGFSLSQRSNISSTEPYFLKTADHLVGGEYFKYTEQNPETGKIENKGGRKQYGIAFSKYGYKCSQMHIYRLENRIREDGSNMVYLLIDGEELGPMNQFYLNLTYVNVDQEQQVDWFNGKDFFINYIFDSWFGFDDHLTMEYIQIWENGEGNAPYDYFAEEILPSNCTKGEQRVRTCFSCGLVDSTEISLPLGHDWDTGVVTREPTCTEAGIRTYKCLRDPSHSRTEEIPLAEHMPIADPRVEPSCTGEGLTEGSHCGACGVVLTAQEPIPMTEHAWKQEVCTVCGAKSENWQAVTRIYGEGRCETARQTADALKKTLDVEKFDAIVYTSGVNFADALAGSHLAAKKQAPILLHLDSGAFENMAYIQENLTEGGTVYILGGESAVPATVDLALNGMNIQVQRVAGSNRFLTNLEILNTSNFSGGEILVCTAMNFADSLSASATGKPILLVLSTWTELSEDYVNYLSRFENLSFTIVGGEAAVSAELEQNLTNYGSVRRVYGSNRFTTSVEVAKQFIPDAGTAVLAYAMNFPDGLCGGPLAYAMGAPLILTTDSGADAAGSYAAEAGITQGCVLGGPGLISEETAAAIFGE